MELYKNPEFNDRLSVTLGEWRNYFIDIVPMLYNDRLVMTPKANTGFYDFGWCFPKGGAAALAAMAWNPETEDEPKGFIKRVGLTARKAPGCA